MKALESYNKLVDAYMKNAECIQALLKANEAIKQEVEVLLTTTNVEHSYFTPGPFEHRVVRCYACGFEHDADIEYDKEDDYLDENACRDCGHDELLIFDLYGKQYNRRTGEYEDTEV